jgi:hypothetical protein
MLPGAALPSPDAMTWGGAPAVPQPSDLSFGPQGSLPGAEAAGGASAGRPPSHRKRLVVAGVIVSMVVALGIVAGVNITSRAGGIHAALTGVFSSPTLRVVVSAQAGNAAEESNLQPYSIVLSVTSENGRAPLSGADGVDNYEVSVMRGGVDVADVIYADQAVYARVDLQAIDPNAYASAVRSMDSSATPAAVHQLEQALLARQWIGITDNTIKAFATELGEGPGQQPSTPKLDNLRNAFTLSFAQSWDAWASIHQLSSSNGTTEYALRLPVEHFVAAFLVDIKAAILKAVPTADARVARMELTAASAAVKRIPAGLAIPITMWVTGGSLTRLQVSYKGDSLNLGISHPALGVSAPQDAFMITPALYQSFFGMPCTSVSGLGPRGGSGGSGGSVSSSCTSIVSGSGGGYATIPMIGTSGTSGMTSTSSVSGMRVSSEGLSGSSSSG